MAVAGGASAATTFTRMMNFVSFGAFSRRGGGSGGSDRALWNDKEPDLLGAPADVTPARTFFVRMVAQREVEVQESEWFSILERHGCFSGKLNNTFSPPASSEGSSRILSVQKHLREQTSGLQILKTPLQNEEDRDDISSSGTGRQFISSRESDKTRIPIIRVLSPFSIYYATWQYFMMLIDITYTAFWVPYSVVFVLEDCVWSHPTAIADFVVGWLYVSDILINLRVGYSVVYKLSRTVELDGWRAALWYITKGTFWVDLPATIPVFVQTVCLSIDGAETNFGINITQMMRLLRLLRLARALRLLMSDALDVASVSVKRATGARMIWLQFIQILILFGWTAHIMACVWYYTAVMEDSESYKKWPHKQGEIWSCIEGNVEDAPDTWLKTAGLLCAPNSIKYMASFYFATMTITTVGYGDISADTTGEQAVATVMMFIGAIFFGYLVSTTTLFLEKVSSQKRELSSYHDKIELVDYWVRNRNIPKKLNMKIRSYYSIVWSKARELQNEKKILMELPFPLRAAAAEHITLPLMQQVLCLSHVDQKHWKHISRRFRAEWYPPGKFIAHSEGRGSGEGLKPEMDSLWLLERGKVVSVKQEGPNVSLIGPQVFGCSLILRKVDANFPLETDTNTYMSTTPVWLWRINKEYLLQYFSVNRDALVQFCEGVLVDLEQLKLLNVDSDMENSLYAKVLQMKDELPEEEDLAMSLPRGPSRQSIYTIQEDGAWEVKAD